MANIYTNSNIFVLNSYKIDKWEEFFGITLLEAMAAKLPIVATDCVGPKELVINGKNGFLVKQKDSENFYKSLKILVENPKIRNKMGEEGRKIVENYSIEKVSMKLYKILDSMK